VPAHQALTGSEEEISVESELTAEQVVREEAAVEAAEAEPVDSVDADGIAPAAAASLETETDGVPEAAIETETAVAEGAEITVGAADEPAEEARRDEA
jgi:hypothetical protein